jgi:nucleoside-diphosphate-sugar epimerase
MEVVVMRPPLVYGPEVRANFLNLMHWIVKGIPLPLASVKNQRSFIYLGNMVDAIMTCINHPKAAGETYLVNDREDVSTPELIRRLAHALGCSARLFPFPVSLLRLGGRLCGETEKTDRLLGSSVVDSSKIGRELGWSPPYTMQYGLQATADWYTSGQAG